MSHHPPVLQLTHAGIPINFIGYQEAVCHYVKGHVTWELGDEDYTVYGGVSRMSGIQSEVVVRPIIAVHTDGLGDGTKRLGKTPQLNNKKLFTRDNYTCGYCGDIHPAHHLTRDHIIPTSRGGKDIWMNCITACKSCNNVKADRTPEQADMPLLFSPYTPTFAEDLVMRHHKSILPSQLSFLIPLMNPHSRVLRGLD